MNTIPKKPNLDWLKYFKKYIYYKHGNLYSLNLRSSAGKNKTPIGRINSSGYYTIVFERNRGNYICIKNHHLIWFLNTGEWPSNEIDHINRDKLDNRIENLRLANRMINMNNIEKTPGQTKHSYIQFRNNRYEVVYKRKYIGSSKNLEKAIEIKRIYLNEE